MCKSQIKKKNYDTKSKKKKPSLKMQFFIFFFGLVKFFTLPEGNTECRRSSEQFSIFQSAQPCECDETCFLGWRVVRSIWFLCLWRANLFLGQKSYYLPFCFFGFSTVMDASRWVIQSYSHHFSYIVPLYFDWFFFFGKLFYFDWLLVLKITLWSYLLKKKKKTLWSYDLWTQRDNFHVIHNCHCHKWLADKESELG